MATKTITTTITLKPEDLTIFKTDVDGIETPIPARLFPAALIEKVEGGSDDNEADCTYYSYSAADDNDTEYTILLHMYDTKTKALEDEPGDPVKDLMVAVLKEEQGKPVITVADLPPLDRGMAEARSGEYHVCLIHPTSNTEKWAKWLELAEKHIREEHGTCWRGDVQTKEGQYSIVANKELSTDGMVALIEQAPHFPVIDTWTVQAEAAGK